MTKRRKKTICLDFDGVLHSYTSGWKGPRNIPDPIVPGAVLFLLEASYVFDVAVLSARSRYIGGRRAMKRWLQLEIEKEFHKEIGEIFEQKTVKVMNKRIIARSIVRDIKWPVRKIPASVYIDDRGMTFNGTWPSIQSLVKFTPWNREPPG